MTIRALILLLLAGPAFGQITLPGTPGQVDDDGTYAPESGSNRLVLWTVGTRDTGFDDLTGAAYNSIAMTADAGPICRTVGSADYCVGLFRAVEANLPGGSATMTITVQNGDPTQDEGIAITLTDAVQDAPSCTTVSQSSTPSWAFSGLSVVDGGMAVIAFSANNALGAPAGYTEVESSATPPNVSLFYKAITADGTETPTVTCSSCSGAGVGIFCEFEPVAADNNAAGARRRY